MDNKIKYLCVAIAILLAYSGYLRYNLWNTQGKTQPVAEGKTQPVAEGKTQPVAGLQESSLAGRYDNPTLGYSLYLRGDNVAEVGGGLEPQEPKLRVGDWSLNNKEVIIVLPRSGFAISETRYYRINGNDLIWIASKGESSPRRHFAEKDFKRLKKAK